MLAAKNLGKPDREAKVNPGTKLTDWAFEDFNEKILPKEFRIQGQRVQVRGHSIALASRKLTARRALSITGAAFLSIISSLAKFSSLLPPEFGIQPKTHVLLQHANHCVLLGCCLLFFPPNFFFVKHQKVGARVYAVRLAERAEALARLTNQTFIFFFR